MMPFSQNLPVLNGRSVGILKASSLGLAHFSVPDLHCSSILFFDLETDDETIPP